MFEWDLFSKKLEDFTKSILENKTEVEVGINPIDPKSLYVKVPKWVKYDQVVAVSADLKNSTQLLESSLFNKSVAAIHDAAVGSLESIFGGLKSDFVDIQGDGAFALFTGEQRFEKALVAAVSISSYSRDVLEKALQRKWGDQGPKTGFKTGISSGSILAKKIGEDKDSRSPVWIGTPVNYAVKIGSEVEIHEIGISKSVAEAISSNQYLMYSCGHNRSETKRDPKILWKNKTFETINSEEKDGLLLAVHWCEFCGDDFIESILLGKKNRNLR